MPQGLGIDAPTFLLLCMAIGLMNSLMSPAVCSVKA